MKSINLQDEQSRKWDNLKIQKFKSERMSKYASVRVLKLNNQKLQR